MALFSTLRDLIMMPNSAGITPSGTVPYVVSPSLPDAISPQPQPSFGRRLLSAIPSIVEGGVIAGAHRNTASGGLGDFFGAMKDVYDANERKQQEKLRQQDQLAQAALRNAQTGYYLQRPGLTQEQIDETIRKNKANEGIKTSGLNAMDAYRTGLLRNQATGNQIKATLGGLQINPGGHPAASIGSPEGPDEGSGEAPAPTPPAPVVAPIPEANLTAKQQADLAKTRAQTGQATANAGLTKEKTTSEEARRDLLKAQSDLATARSEYVLAQKDNLPDLMANAKARIATAQQNAATALGRLGLSQKEFEANFYGTVGGEPIPGAPADESGKPIGVKTAAITKPSQATRTAGDQGTIIKKAGDALIAEIDAKKNKVGNLGSYWNQFVNGTPISDPDAAGLMTSLASFAALQPKLHGFRSSEAMKHFSEMIGGIPKNPEALKAAIRSIQNTAGIVEGVGQIPRVGGRVGGASPGGVVKWGRDANGNPVPLTQ